MSETVAAVRERPILFSGPMVRAILDDRKTQTRRVILPQPEAGLGYQLVGGRARPVGRDYPDSDSEAIKCPYGQPDDLLWVRETCRAHEITTEEAEVDAFGRMAHLGRESPPYGLDGVIYRAGGAFREIEDSQAAADEWGKLYHYGRGCGRWVGAIHMPRWASRLTLLVTDVRVERVRDISEADAEAEGLTKRGEWWDVGADWTGDGLDTTASGAFRIRWDDLNAKRGYGWNENPWVWVISFERMTAPISHDCLTRGV